MELARIGTDAGVVDIIKSDYAYPSYWEIVFSNGETNSHTLRMRLPGGWLYRHLEHDVSCMTYVPEHFSERREQ